MGLMMFVVLVLSLVVDSIRINASEYAEDDYFDDFETL